MTASGLKMIIAVDFDGTLYDGKQVNLALINRLKAEQARGNIVILWTCRERDSLKKATTILLKVGFAPNYINQNAPQTIKKMGNTRKVFADVYIDDKAARV